MLCTTGSWYFASQHNFTSAVHEPWYHKYRKGFLRHTFAEIENYSTSAAANDDDGLPLTVFKKLSREIFDCDFNELPKRGG